MPKYKLFTHTDLDGVGCAIVAFAYLGQENVEVTYCDYHEINEAVKAFIDEGKTHEYDRVFITDISVNEEVAKLVDKESKLLRTVWRLIDHHGTALALNDYRWAWVEVENVEGKTSGTSMFNDYLAGMCVNFLIPVQDFVEAVRRYDTWEWKTIYSDEQAKQLNDLLFILGRDRFIERFTSDISVEFNETERLLLELEREAIDRYYESKVRQVFEVDLPEGTIVAVLAERYQSELGSRLGERFPMYKAIALINPSRSVSLRTIHDDVDVSAIAKRYGGGGHPKAAGFPLPPQADTDFIDYIFNGEGEE